MKRIDAESETLIPTGGFFDTPEITGTLTADTHPGAYTGQDAYNDRLIPMAFDCKASGRNGFGVGDITSTLRAMGSKDGNRNAGGQLAVSGRMGVRRLTPMECERLMSFPDGWTDITYNGKSAADGPRYKSLGNSMIVNKMRWVLSRLDSVNNLIGENL